MRQFVPLENLQHLGQRSSRTDATTVSPSRHLEEQLLESVITQVSRTELMFLQPSAEGQNRLEAKAGEAT
jgi:hypothetical protein